MNNEKRGEQIQLWGHGTVRTELILQREPRLMLLIRQWRMFSDTFEAQRAASFEASDLMHAYYGIVEASLFAGELVAARGLVPPPDRPKVSPVSLPLKGRVVAKWKVGVAEAAVFANSSSDGDLVHKVTVFRTELARPGYACVCVPEDIDDVCDGLMCAEQWIRNTESARWLNRRLSTF